MPPRGRGMHMGSRGRLGAPLVRQQGQRPLEQPAEGQFAPAAVAVVVVAAAALLAALALPVRGPTTSCSLPSLTPRQPSFCVHFCPFQTLILVQRLPRRETAAGEMIPRTRRWAGLSPSVGLVGLAVRWPRSMRLPGEEESCWAG